VRRGPTCRTRPAATAWPMRRPPPAGSRGPLAVRYAQAARDAHSGSAANRQRTSAQIGFAAARRPQSWRERRCPVKAVTVTRNGRGRYSLTAIAGVGEKSLATN
jgi:hypothetical protein